MKKFLYEFLINKEEYIVCVLIIYDSFLYIGILMGFFFKNLVDDYVFYILFIEKKNIIEDNRNVKFFYVDF